MKDMLKSHQAYEAQRLAQIQKNNRIAQVQNILGIIASNAVVGLACYVIFKAMNLELPL
jgi:hypothetical protein